MLAASPRHAAEEAKDGDRAVTEERMAALRNAAEEMKNRQNPMVW